VKQKILFITVHVFNIERDFSSITLSSLPKEFLSSSAMDNVGGKSKEDNEIPLLKTNISFFFFFYFDQLSSQPEINIGQNAMMSLYE
jgi:hypothetical protein